MIRERALSLAIQSCINPAETPTGKIIARAKDFERFLNGIGADEKQFPAQHPPGSVAAEIEASIIPSVS